MVAVRGGELHPETDLTGLFEEDLQSADVDAVLLEIKAAMAEAARLERLRAAEEPIRAHRPPLRPGIYMTAAEHRKPACRPEMLAGRAWRLCAGALSRYHDSLRYHLRITACSNSFVRRRHPGIVAGLGRTGQEVAIECQRLGLEVIACDRYPNAPRCRWRIAATCSTCWIPPPCVRW